MSAMEHLNLATDYQGKSAKALEAASQAAGNEDWEQCATLLRAPPTTPRKAPSHSKPGPTPFALHRPSAALGLTKPAKTLSSEVMEASLPLVSHPKGLSEAGEPT